MEKSSYGEHARLGLGSPRSFGNHPISSLNTSQRNSDIDFHDVFGGPPRTSFTERRESVDSNLVRGSVEIPSSHNLRAAPSEKPVFGWESPRRKHLSNDFFDDIFDSSSSIPRRPDREILSSLPASRILSPTHPAPPNREPFIGASSLPANLRFFCFLSSLLCIPSAKPF
ncbi:molecular chaperone [Asimina triloba]